MGKKKKKEKKGSEPEIRFHIKERGNMTLMDCITCGLPFAIPDSFYKTAVKEFGRSFHCLQGHSMINVIGYDKQKERQRKDDEKKKAKEDKILAEKLENRGLLLRILLYKVF